MLNGLVPGDQYMGELVVDVIDTVQMGELPVRTITTRRDDERGRTVSEWVDGVCISVTSPLSAKELDDRKFSAYQGVPIAAPPTPEEPPIRRLIEQVGTCIACDGDAEMLLCGLCKEAMSEVRKQWVKGFIEDMEEGLA